jgi:hypothetical protein
MEGAADSSVIAAMLIGGAPTLMLFPALRRHFIRSRRRRRR